jgi:YVTN family beta-propeller protein
MKKVFSIFRVVRERNLQTFMLGTVMQPRWQSVVGVICVIVSAVCAVTPVNALDEVYVVNSYVHGPPLDWSTLVSLRGSDLEITNSLTLGSGAHSVAPSRDARRLWVTVPPDHRIEIVNRSSFEFIHSIVLEDEHFPRGIVFNPDGTRVYVGLSSSGQVGVFDTDSYDRLALIPVGGDPDVIVFTPTGEKAYVVKLQGPSGVAVIRTSDYHILRTIDIEGEFLQEAVISPDGTKLYVTNTAQHRIEVIRTSDDTLLEPIATLNYPRALGISPDGRYLFIGYRIIGQVEMLRLSDGEIVARYGNPDIVDARRIVVRPDGTRFYLVDHSNDAAYAFDVDGESFSRALIRDLNTLADAQASPLGLALVESGLWRPEPELPRRPLFRGSLGLIDCGPCPACFERFCDPRVNPELDLFLIWESEEEIARSFSRSKLGIDAKDGSISSAATLVSRERTAIYLAALPSADTKWANAGSILFFNRDHKLLARIDGKAKGEALGLDMDVWGNEVVAVSTHRLLRMRKGKIHFEMKLPADLHASRDVQVAFTADVDGDKRPDILLGAPYADAGEIKNAGRILVIGSKTNQVIDTMYGRIQGQKLGRFLQPLYPQRAR